MSRSMHHCPICDNARTTMFLQREPVAVHQNLLVSDELSARKLARGRLVMRACGRCGLMFNAAFDPTLMDYSAAYDNTQTWSPTFERHTQDLVDLLLSGHGLRNSRIVEVGCGKGTFLERLVADPGNGNRAIGFDPSYVGQEVRCDGRLRFEKRFFDETCTDVTADVVLCRHVIEHIQQPLDLLKSVRQALNNSPNALVCFETPCARWILEHRVIWDLFYEHCSIFTAESLAAAFDQTGFRVETVRHVFGGQYLWLEARPDGDSHAQRHPVAGFAELAASFGRSEQALRESWRASVADWSKQGKVVLWGAGAKGVTFANLIDPARQHIAAVVDLNPHKAGHYLPGSAHPIIAPDDLPDFAASFALVLNPNYFQEIQSHLKQLTPHTCAINLMESS